MNTRITVTQRKRIEMPQTLGEIAVLFAKLTKEYGKTAVLDMDAGHNNIDTEVVFQRHETPAETKEREEKERKRREGRIITHRRRVDKCQRCNHARHFHMGTPSACCGDPDGLCECIQFKETKK